MAEIQNRLRVKRVLHIRVLDRADELAGLLQDEMHVSEVLQDETGVHVHFGGGDAEQAQLLGRMISLGFQVLSFNEAQTNLEDVFLEITKGGASDELA